MVRAKGIEPSSSAWEADVLPLYHARNQLMPNFISFIYKCPVENILRFFRLICVGERPSLFNALNNRKE